jgi:hypothetical protein
LLGASPTGTIIKTAVSVGQMKKGATAAPFFFLTGKVGLALLASLLLPALGFLRHVLLSPPSCGF